MQTVSNSSMYIGLQKPKYWMQKLVTDCMEMEDQ